MDERPAFGVEHARAILLVVMGRVVVHGGESFQVQPLVALQGLVVSGQDRADANLVSYRFERGIENGQSLVEPGRRPSRGMPRDEVNVFVDRSRIILRRNAPHHDVVAMPRADVIGGRKVVQAEGGEFLFRTKGDDADGRAGRLFRLQNIEEKPANRLEINDGLAGPFLSRGCVKLEVWGAELQPLGFGGPGGRGCQDTGQYEYGRIHPRSTLTRTSGHVSVVDRVGQQRFPNSDVSRTATFHCLSYGKEGVKSRFPA